jgi:hypothetical protein
VRQLVATGQVVMAVNKAVQDIWEI